MSRLIVITAMFVIPATLALSQVPPMPPEPPQPASPWRIPTLPPMPPMPVLPEISPMPALPNIPPIPPIPPVAAMALADVMASLPSDLADIGLLAFQGTRTRDEAQRARDEARRARDEVRRAQDTDERYYRSGKSYLDRKEYDRAVDAFNRVIENKGSRADGALYWRAYAQNKLGKRDDALASLGELQKTYSSSRWLDDAKALQVEVRSQSGQPVSPESASDEDLKLLAVSSLMHSEPERSVPILENLLKTSNSPKLKERALFVLAQIHSQKSRDVLAGVAKGGSNPDLQIKAIEYLGVYGGGANLQTLVDVYKSANDVHVKRSILNSFMVSGSRDNLLSVAKSESTPALKIYAIQLLGNVGGSADLAQLYAGESSPEVKRAIIQGLFVSGNSDKLFELAKNEKDDSLRHLAINQLGVMGRSKTGAALVSMYAQETNADNKKAIINALFVQGNATGLIEIARKESDINLKKTIVNQLSVMHSKEATDYLMEILSK